MKPTLPEPLFLLHSGANYGNEQDDWDVEANSGQLVDAVCAHYPNQTIGLHDEKIVQSLIDRAYEAGKADAQKWRPIESAPMTGKPLLLWWKHAGAMRGRFVDDSRFGSGWMCDGDQVMPINQSDCTHWMPLPPPPEQPK